MATLSDSPLLMVDVSLKRDYTPESYGVMAIRVGVLFPANDRVEYSQLLTWIYLCVRDMNQSGLNNAHCNNTWFPSARLV